MRKRGLLVSVLLVALMPPWVGARERIFTWVDESGHVRHTVIREAEPEPLAPSEETRAGQTGGGPDLPVPVNTPGNLPQQAIPDADASNTEARNSHQPDITVRDGEANISGQLTPGTDGSFVLDGVVYEDAAALEARGFTRKDRPRFMTWVDATGQIRSDPLPVTEQDPSPPVLDDEKPVILARSEPVPADLAESCCGDLADVAFNHLEMAEDDSELLIRFEKDEPLATLLGSQTPFRLITLPERDTGMIYRVRTFVGSKAVYPTLITLDLDYRPVRVLKDVVYRYAPKTWFRHAFIEGYIVLAPGERHLLVVIDDADLERQTVTLGLSDKPIVVRHGKIGDIHFLAVR